MSAWQSFCVEHSRLRIEFAIPGKIIILISIEDVYRVRFDEIEEMAKWPMIRDATRARWREDVG